MPTAASALSTLRSVVLLIANAFVCIWKTINRRAQQTQIIPMKQKWTKLVWIHCCMQNACQFTWKTTFNVLARASSMCSKSSPPFATFTFYAAAHFPAALKMHTVINRWCGDGRCVKCHNSCLWKVHFGGAGCRHHNGHISSVCRFAHRCINNVAGAHPTRYEKRTHASRRVLDIRMHFNCRVARPTYYASRKSLHSRHWRFFCSGATTIHTSRMAHGGRFSHHRMANVKRICGPSSHHRMCVGHTSRYGMASRKSSFSKPCASFHIQFCCCCECVMCFWERDSVGQQLSTMRKFVYLRKRRVCDSTEHVRGRSGHAHRTHYTAAGGGWVEQPEYGLCAPSPSPPPL